MCGDSVRIPVRSGAGDMNGCQGSTAAKDGFRHKSMLSGNEDPRGRVRDLKQKVNRALRRNAEFGDYAGPRRKAVGKYSHRAEHAWFRRRGSGWFRVDGSRSAGASGPERAGAESIAGAARPERAGAGSTAGAAGPERAEADTAAVPAGKAGGLRGKLPGRLRRKRTVKERRENRVSWSFLMLSLSGVMLFFVVPFLVVIYYSMIDNPVRHRFVGLDNYWKVFTNSAFRLAALNTLKFSLVAVPLAVALSLLLAVVMEQRLPWKSRFRSFFLSPMMVPTASVIMIWQILFHYNGLVNVLLGRLGISRIDWLKSSYAQVPIILLFLWKNLGYNMILFMAGLANIPRDQIEVARLESATEFQIFWLIKIRYLSSTLLFVTIMSMINSFKVFREVYLMAGDYPYDALYMLQHFMNNTFRSLDYQKLSAAAVLMALFMILVIGALFVAEDRFGRDIE